jgi:hypothetical protein
MVKIEVCCDQCHTVITAERTKLVIFEALDLGRRRRRMGQDESIVV